MTFPPLPRQTRRLFHGYSADQLTRTESRDFVAEALLEDGDGEDLNWLAAEVGESVLRDLVERRGRRGLSARSYRFWRLALEGQLETEPCQGGDFWPLASP